ncbi:MAG: PIN domain-containing protein [Verrucomicrobia bacterium]|nr:PIN domain-containing protein [Verrucomicrobiota bacterium]
MKVFLDTSVLLAAAGSSKGASRFVFQHAKARGWQLLSSSYCIEETHRNIGKIGPKAAPYWRAHLFPDLALVPIELAFDQVLVFPKAKDRPVLLSAFGAEADVLLTLDEADFQKVIGGQIYSLQVRSPGQFLIDQREAGLL